MPTPRSVQTRSAQQRRQGLPRFIRNRTQKFPQALLPILEDPFDIPPHKEPVDQRPTTRAIMHIVQAKRAAILSRWE